MRVRECGSVVVVLKSARECVGVLVRVAGRERTFEEKRVRIGERARESVLKGACEKSACESACESGDWESA
jgi:hypothetical protein